MIKLFILLNLLALLVSQSHADIQVVATIMEPPKNRDGSPIVDLSTHVVCYSQTRITAATVQEAESAGANCQLVFPASSASPAEGSQIDSPPFVCPGNECYIRVAHTDLAGNMSGFTPEAHALLVPVDTEPPATTSVLIIKSVMPVSP